MFTVTEKIRFIEAAFGKGDVARNLSNIQVTCPICVSRDSKWRFKRKLAIRLADDVTHCWVCGFSSRSLFPLLKRFACRDDIDTYREKFASVSLTAIEAPPREPLRLPGDFRLLAAELDTRDPDVRSTLTYLRSRNISERDLWFFKFGYTKQHRRRAVMPSFDANGSLNFWVARAIDGEARPKYVVPGREQVDKQEIVFNDINIDWSRELVLVEGPFDLVKCPDNTIPLLGNQLSEKTLLFNKIIMHETPCVVMLDDDASLRASNICKSLYRYNVPVRKADLGGKKDPGDMSKDEVLERIASARVWNWEDHLLEKFSNIRIAL